MPTESELEAALMKIAILVCTYDKDDVPMTPEDSGFRSIYVICEGVLGKPAMKKALAGWKKGRHGYG